MATVKLSKEDANAMRIQAAIQGMSFEDYVKSKVPEGITEDIVIEIEGKKERKGTSTKGEKKTSTKKDDTPMIKDVYIPELEQYKRVNRSIKLQVNYSEHDIAYKEQLWKMPQRSVEYTFELVKLPKIAKDIADKFSKNSLSEREKAEKGLVRYIRVINYDENISYLIREIAYIRIEIADGKLSKQVMVKNKALKENNANPEKVKKNINKELEKLLIAE